MVVDNFIKEYPNVIPKQICTSIINYFEEEHRKGQTHKGTVGSGLDLNIKDTTDLSLRIQPSAANGGWDVDDTPDCFKILNNIVMEKCHTYIHEYFEAYGRHTITDDMFDTSMPDSLLIQRYDLPDGGYHQLHQDWSPTYPFNKRMLVAMTYLNDVKEGGETEFHHQKVKIKPEQGKLVIWPTYFTHLHKGHKPISNTKYIINKWFYPVPF